MSIFGTDGVAFAKWNAAGSIGTLPEAVRAEIRAEKKLFGVYERTARREKKYRSTEERLVFRSKYLRQCKERQSDEAHRSNWQRAKERVNLTLQQSAARDVPPAK